MTVMVIENHCPTCDSVLAEGRHGVCPSCVVQSVIATAGAPPEGDLPPLDQLERAFPDFEITGVLGRGGMGAVYRARHRKLDRPVALKILLPTLSGDPQFEARFTREAQIMANLDHPHVVSLYDVGERDGLLFLAMEFSDGLNLRQLLDSERLEIRDVLRIAPQICDSLQFAHDRGVVHRDIKPENILIDEDLRVRITDFGLAKLVGEEGDRTTPRLTAARQVVGTPHYMAPEQVREGEVVGVAADVYSIGVVLYEMLTGEVPLGNYPRASAREGVPRWVDDVIAKALARDPNERYPSARAMKAALFAHTRLADPTTCPDAELLEREWSDGPKSTWSFGRTDVLWFGAVGALVVWFSLFSPWYHGPQAEDRVYGLFRVDPANPVIGWHLIVYELPSALIGVYALVFLMLSALALRTRRVSRRVQALPAVAGVAHTTMLMWTVSAGGDAIPGAPLAACGAFVAILFLALRRRE